ncbi:MAG TPA: hypothetical protein VG709_01160 [Actinomycetota bacterium]|nr:hypothetical protein [Actinomycetota bacterium]
MGRGSDVPKRRDATFADFSNYATLERQNDAIAAPGVYVRSA